MENNRTIQAKMIAFNGVLYRSKAEYTFAKFLTAMGFNFEYEPFVWIDGKYKYRPDFVIYDFRQRDCETPYKVFVEIKPNWEIAHNENADETLATLSKKLNTRAILIISQSWTEGWTIYCPKFEYSDTFGLEELIPDLAPKRLPESMSYSEEIIPQGFVKPYSDDLMTLKWNENKDILESYY